MPSVGFYVLGVISILIVVSVICFRNKEGLTNAINVQLSGKLRIITPGLGGSATSHPIALSRPVLANELADFTPVDMFGSPTSHGVVSSDGLGNSANEGILESKPTSTVAPSSDSCPSGCTKPTIVAGNCAQVTIGGEKRHVCPYVCTGDYNSGCQGLDEVCRNCGNVTLPETTPAPPTPKNKFYGMVVQFSNTSSKPPPKKPESPYIDTAQYCDGGKIYIHADSYNASSQEVTDEAECATKCDGDSSCQMMLMSSPTTCHLYRDVDNVSMHCKSIPGYAAYWGEVRSDRYKGGIKYPAGSSSSKVTAESGYYVVSKGTNVGLRGTYRITDTVYKGRRVYHSTGNNYYLLWSGTQYGGRWIFQTSANFATSKRLGYIDVYKRSGVLDDDDGVPQNSNGISDWRANDDVGRYNSGTEDNLAKKKIAEVNKYYVTSKGVLRKTGSGCTQRPVVLDMSLTDFLSTNKFTLGSPMSSSDTCAASSSS